MKIKFLLLLLPILSHATYFSEDIGLTAEDEAFLFGLTGVLVGFTIFFTFILSIVLHQGHK